MHLSTRKNWLNFGSHPPLDQDLGSFWRSLQHCNMRHFSTIWLVSLENRHDLRDNFIIDVSLHKEVPINFWKTWEPDSRRGLDSPQWRSVQSTCSCFSRNLAHTYAENEWKLNRVQLGARIKQNTTQIANNWEPLLQSFFNGEIHGSNTRKTGEN